MQANQANVTFNTHEAVKALKGSGFDEKQAESVVETINKAVNETVATKADLAVLGADLAILGADLKVQGAKIEALRETVGGIKENMATKDELKVLTKTVEGIQENIKENMATKDELKVLTKTVEGIQENVEKTMDTKMAKLETRMLRMMWLQLMAMLGMFVTMVVALT